ncbi:hypothetical protein [Acinetobacter towneri]|uniref:Uncharacterized protein n=1 Tax=Acinetobacter towneri TaxID=202956 RepID=A0AAP9GVR5_9GAMM|nr:hypothetical protein [Acinetobacter towneri]QGM27252.1 hypothetical protein GJD93_05985 [Acinetobacter towneri]
MELEQIVLWVLVLLFTYQFILSCIGMASPLHYIDRKRKRIKKHMEYQEKQYSLLNSGEKVWTYKIASACALVIQGVVIFALLKALNVI